MTKESNKVFDGFEIGWTKFDSLSPMKLGFLSAVEGEKCGCKVRNSFNMASSKVSATAHIYQAGQC